MEARINNRTYHIPHTCPTDGLKLSTLRRNLKQHGPEAFLTSKKLAPYAACIADDLRKAGVQIEGR